MDQPRKAKGTPDGGRFAANPHAEAGSELPVPAPTVDGLDYADAAMDATYQAGLPDVPLDHIDYDSYSAVNVPEDGIAFRHDVKLSDIDADYMSSDLAEAWRDTVVQTPDRTIHFSTCEADLLGDSQLISVALSDAEQETVADRLRADEWDFAEERVAAWSHGDPAKFASDFASDPRATWAAVAKAVRALGSDASRVMVIAAHVRANVVSNFASDCEHLGSDEWVAEQLQTIHDERG